jgi:MarR family transcriptional regulator, transcriptional regulator for hemolysin
MNFDQFQSAGYMVNLCARLFSQRITEALSPYGVTTAYLPVLYTLDAQGEMSQGELAELISIEQPTMTRTLGRMERDGFIARAQDPANGRRILARLTEHGKAIAPRVEAIAMAINDDVMAELAIGTPEFIQVLTALADELRDRGSIAEVVERVERTLP